MITIKTVSSALPKNIDRLKSFTEDLETIQQPRTSGHSSILFEKVILKPHCVFCNKEGRKKIKEKGVWTTEATTVFECQCLKLQIKGTRSSHGGSEVLILLQQVFTAAVADSIREAKLTAGVQMKKTREGRRTLKSHIGQPL